MCSIKIEITLQSAPYLVVDSEVSFTFDVKFPKTFSVNL